MVQKRNFQRRGAVISMALSPLEQITLLQEQNNIFADKLRKNLDITNKLRFNYFKELHHLREMVIEQ